ncbi:MAG: hypothetical protein ACYDDA_14670 [Acidiferrobacteraceae bacterium]
MISGYIGAIFGRQVGAGLVRPVITRPPNKPGGESAVCPPGFEPKLVGPGQYECVRTPSPPRSIFSGPLGAAALPVAGREASVLQATIHVVRGVHESQDVLAVAHQG